MSIEFDVRWDSLLAALSAVCDALYDDDDPPRARALTPRLNAALATFPEARALAIGQECLAVLAEAHGDWPSVAKHRRAEVDLIDRRLQLGNQQPRESVVGPGIRIWRHTHEELADRLDLLAIAEWECGNHVAALAALDRSESVCLEHRIPFDGKELRAEILDHLRGTGLP